MASVFKQQCLALLDQVAATHTPIVVTKHGRPVAKLVALDEADRGRSTDGSVTLVAADDEDYYSSGEPWNVA